jgi:hypothetical protein
VHVARARRQVQRREAALAARGDVSADLQQQARHMAAALRSGEVERAGAIQVAR